VRPKGKDKSGGGNELKLRKRGEFSIPTFHTVASSICSTSGWNGIGVPSSCALFGGFAIGARVSLLSQHSAEREMSASACTRSMPACCCYQTLHSDQDIVWLQRKRHRNSFCCNPEDVVNATFDYVFLKLISISRRCYTTFFTHCGQWSCFCVLIVAKHVDDIELLMISLSITIIIQIVSNLKK